MCVREGSGVEWWWLAAPVGEAEAAERDAGRAPAASCENAPRPTPSAAAPHADRATRSKDGQPLRHAETRDPVARATPQERPRRAGLPAHEADRADLQMGRWRAPHIAAAERLRGNPRTPAPGRPN